MRGTLVMSQWLFLILTTISVILFQNCSAIHQQGDGSLLSSSSSTVNDLDMQKSLTAFEDTLFPITQEAGSCVSCHGVNQQPLHSMSDPSIAHDVMISFGLVNLRDPSQSKIIKKLENGHEGYDAAFVDRFKAAVQTWSDELVASGGILGIGDGTQPIYSSLFTTLIQSKCVSCHKPGGAAESIDYSDYVSTINTGLIIPGSASASPITQYSAEGHEPTNTAEPMTSAERQALIQWINLGALNN